MRVTATTPSVVSRWRMWPASAQGRSIPEVSTTAGRRASRCARSSRWFWYIWRSSSRPSVSMSSSSSPWVQPAAWLPSRNATNRQQCSWESPNAPELPGSACTAGPRVRPAGRLSTRGPLRLQAQVLLAHLGHEALEGGLHEGLQPGEAEAHGLVALQQLHQPQEALP